MGCKNPNPVLMRKKPKPNTKEKKHPAVARQRGNSLPSAHAGGHPPPPGAGWAAPRGSAPPDARPGQPPWARGAAGTGGLQPRCGAGLGSLRPGPRVRWFPLTSPAGPPAPVPGGARGSYSNWGGPGPARMRTGGRGHPPGGEKPFLGQKV